MSEEQNGSCEYVMVKTESLRPMANLASLLPVHTPLVEGICNSMRESGFDLSQPLVVFGDEVVDGCTRLAAALAAGIKEVPVVYKSFPGRQTAILYAVDRQVLRRNLNDAEIAVLAEYVDKLYSRGGSRRTGTKSDVSKPTAVVFESSADETAATLHVGPGKIERLRAVRKRDPVAHQAVKDGKMSINAAYEGSKPKKKSGDQVLSVGGIDKAASNPNGGDGIGAAQNQDLNYQGILVLLMGAREEAGNDSELLSLIDAAIKHAERKSENAALVAQDEFDD